jgi:hypothetical protein
MKREPGYYWVLNRDEEWIIAEWRIGYYFHEWYSLGKFFEDSEWLEIDENQIKRNV